MTGRIKTVNYSILMSVYFRETASNLRQALESMMTQSVLTNDFVLVCDGDLTEELDSVISEYVDKFPNVFNIVRIPKNPSWAEVLNIGLKLCKNELVARMDSDDISVPERCEKQLKYMASHPDVDVVSTSLGEFSVNPGEINYIRRLPEHNTEIIEFAKYRCPLNHATVIYKKSAVLKSGGYQYFPAYEDYHLWVRMIINKCVLANMPDVLYLMRAGENLYARRGGFKYFKFMANFRFWMRKQKLVGTLRTLSLIVANGAVILMPNSIRGFIYKKFLRK